MTLYFCLDDRNGMRFNNRRQSRDAAVLEDIRSRMTKDLLVDPMSQRMMERAQIPYLVMPPELPEDLEGLHYFVEERAVGEWVSLASTVVLYRWNRHYPADQFFDIDLNALGFSLVETVDFPGNSHENITREVYVK